MNFEKVAEEVKQANEIFRSQHKRYLLSENFVYSLVLILLYERLELKHYKVPQNRIYQEYFRITRQSFNLHKTTKKDLMHEVGIVEEPIDGKQVALSLNMETFLKWLADY